MLRCKQDFQEHRQMSNLQKIIAALRANDSDELRANVEHFKEYPRQREGLIKEAVATAGIDEAERIAVVKLLVDTGADLKAVDASKGPKQLTLLEQALVDNKLLLSDYLWEQGLKLAVEHFPVERVTCQNLEWLKQKGYELCQFDEKNQTLLHRIIVTKPQDEQTAEDAITYLIEQGILKLTIKKPNKHILVPDENDQTKFKPKETEYSICKNILDLAAQHNHGPALRALVKYKFDKYSFRALESAVEHDNAELLNYLMEHYTIRPAPGEQPKMRGPEESEFFNQLLNKAKKKCLPVLQKWQQTRLPEIVKTKEEAAKKQVEQAYKSIKKQDDEDALHRMRYKRRFDSNMGMLMGGMAGCLIGFILGSLFPLPLVSVTTCAVIGGFCGCILGFGIAYLLSRFTNSLGVYTAFGGEALGAGIGAVLGYFFIPVPGLNFVIGSSIGAAVGAVVGGIVGNCFNYSNEEVYRPSFIDNRIVIIEDGLFSEFTYGKDGQLTPASEISVSERISLTRGPQFFSAAATSDPLVSSRQIPASLNKS